MSKVLIYILGVISGFVLTFIGSALIVFVFKPNNASDTKYYDIDFNDKTYVLHTEMPKDSVEMVLGKPYKKDYQTYGNSMHETWLYNNGDIMKLGRDYEVLRLQFEDGKLTDISK